MDIIIDKNGRAVRDPKSKSSKIAIVRAREEKALEHRNRLLELLPAGEFHRTELVRCIESLIPDGRANKRPDQIIPDFVKEGIIQRTGTKTFRKSMPGEPPNNKAALEEAAAVPQWTAERKAKVLAVLEKMPPAFREIQFGEQARKDGLIQTRGGAARIVGWLCQQNEIFSLGKGQFRKRGVNFIFAQQLLNPDGRVIYTLTPENEVRKEAAKRLAPPAFTAKMMAEILTENGVPTSIRVMAATVCAMLMIENFVTRQTVDSSYVYTRTDKDPETVRAALYAVKAYQRGAGAAPMPQADGSVAAEMAASFEAAAQGRGKTKPAGGSSYAASIWRALPDKFTTSNIRACEYAEKEPGFWRACLRKWIDAGDVVKLRDCSYMKTAPDPIAARIASH